MNAPAGRSAALVLAALLPCLAGCRTPLDHIEAEAELLASGRYDLIEGLDVPAVKGPSGCGAQALAAALASLDDSIHAQSLADELPWQDKGASPVDLLLAARSRGFQAVVMHGSWDDLAARVRTGEAVLVMFDASLEVRALFRWWTTVKLMHWGLVSGIAHDGETILTAAEDRRHYVIAREEFLRRWAKSDQCAIVVGAAPEPEPARPETATSPAGPRDATRPAGDLAQRSEPPS